jgi:hypothetical protein
MRMLIMYLFIIGSFAVEVIARTATNRHWILRLMEVWVIAGFSFRLGQRYPGALIRTSRQPPTAPLRSNADAPIPRN